MNKKFKYLITVLILIIIAAGAFYGINSKLNRGKEKEVQINPIQNYKNTDAYVEQNVSSFFQVYSNLVNNKSVEMTYLSDVVDKNSDAYKIIETEINQLRKNSAQILIAITDIKIEQTADNLYVANVTIDKILTEGTDIDATPTNKIILTIKAQEGYKITEYKKVKA